MSGNKTPQDLSERVKLGVPTNDIEAIAMLYEACHQFGIDACMGAGTLTYVSCRHILDSVWHSYVCALRMMRYDLGKKFPRAIENGGSVRFDAYISFVENGGEF